MGEMTRLSSRKFQILLLIIFIWCSTSLFFLISKDYIHISFPKLPKNNITRSEFLPNLNSTEKAKDSRILCLVTTQDKNHKTKALAVKNTWGRKCDRLYFVSNQKDSSLPSIQVKCEKEDHDHLWCKNRKAIMYGMNAYADQFDWFLKTDDDTYIVMENLRYLLSHHNPNQSIWFGCQFALGGDPKVKYMSGGAGYAISRKAMIELNQEFKQLNKCKDVNMGETGADDVEVGKYVIWERDVLSTDRCLTRLGVTFGDSRDEQKRNRFFPFGAGDFVNPNYDAEKGVDWFGKYNVFHNKMVSLQKVVFATDSKNHFQGFNCCSNTTISFHYLNEADIYVYEFLIYHLNVH